MVAHVLRLRAALLVGAFRGPVGAVAWRAVGLVILVAAVVVACTGVLSLADGATEVADVVLVLAGTALTVGFGIGPLVVGAVDPLDPRRFAVVGATPGPLAGALALASLVSLPTLALIAFDVCAAIVWVAHGVPWGAAVAALILHVVSCVLLARAAMAFAGTVLRERRTRELTGMFVLGVVVVFVPVGVFLASLEWGGQVPVQLVTAADVLAVTPFGAAAALPGTLVLTGRVLLVALVAIATAGLIAALWWFAVHRLLTTTENPVGARERSGLGWFAVAPGSASGAVAARSLVYWMRDGRYLVNLVIIPIAAVLTTVPLLVAGVSPQIVALVPVPILALFFGWLPHNDLAYDSTAVWMHIASGMRGLSDRIGRLAPLLLVAVPLLAIAVPVTVALYGRWAILPAVIGVAGSLFLTASGLSSIASVVAPYAVSRPGDSPFTQPQRSGTGGVIAQAVVMLGAVVLSVPTLWNAWLALTADVAYAIPAMWWGLGTGVVVLLAGLVTGAAVFERRGAQLMEFVGAA